MLSADDCDCCIWEGAGVDLGTRLLRAELLEDFVLFEEPPLPALRVAGSVVSISSAITDARLAMLPDSVVLGCML